MDLEKIKKALKDKGLPEDMAKLINVKEESEIEGAVSELEKHFKTAMQSENDRRATEAQKTTLKNFKEKMGIDPNLSDDEVKKLIEGGSHSSTESHGGSNNGGQQTTPGGDDKSNPEVTELKAQVEKLASSLNNMVTTQQVNERKNAFVEKLKAKKVPEKFANEFAKSVNFQELDNEEKLDSYVKDVESTIDEYRKEVISNEVEGKTQPGASFETENVEEHIKETANARWGNSKEATGKEL